MNGLRGLIYISNDDKHKADAKIILFRIKGIGFVPCNLHCIAWANFGIFYNHSYGILICIYIKMRRSKLNIR